MSPFPASNLASEHGKHAKTRVEKGHQLMRIASNDAVGRLDTRRVWCFAEKWSMHVCECKR